MIELNEKTQQDFLNREWVQKLLDAGVDMSDAKYALYRLKDATSDIIVYQGTYFADDRYYNGIKVENIVPTYTASELLYKLHEYIYPTIDGIKCTGEFGMGKVAGQYTAFYKLAASDIEVLKKRKIYDYGWFYLFAKEENFIEALASLLIQCHTHDIGIPNKDTGNISDK